MAPAPVAAANPPEAVASRARLPQRRVVCEAYVDLAPALARQAQNSGAVADAAAGRARTDARAQGGDLFQAPLGQGHHFLAGEIVHLARAQAPRAPLLPRQVTPDVLVGAAGLL